MDLFNNQQIQNVLPCNGVANYHGKVLSDAEIQSYFQSLLLEIPWQQDEVILFGKLIRTARKVAWYGDPGLTYTYSQKTKQPNPWTVALKELKKRVEKECGTTFNSCLLNLYQDGSEGMSWHADDEKELDPKGQIASLSLGASRDFCFKHKETKQKKILLLESGSLLVMKENTQKHWLHSLPKRKKIKTPRINLTFRNILEESRGS